jgi:predicted molibdopterin-dependent oxidoreductase YjgC
MMKGGVHTLYLVGEVPVTKKPNVDYMIVQTSYMTEIARHADVVLPAAAYLESKGSIIDYLGRNRNIKKVVSPPGSSKQHRDIIIELSKAMGKSIRESEVKAKKPAKSKLSPFQKQKGFDVNTSKFTDSIYRPVFECSRLLWLKEAVKTAV